ncbi:UTRA domain-containing protein [Candidatus Sororendozoicomonas aggregata]|uniref:UTRA domain-containing protein n=1 Tax=Candidatus Sororendozoicomonas aggregata TaxID=3073239 RepID=UPI002ED3FD4E
MMITGSATSQRIRQSLCEQIKKGLLLSGKRLPSERQLSEAFGTTRITLREALSALEADGLLYREDRRGWFVSPERIVYNPTTNSNFHQMVSEQGRIAKTQLLNASLIMAPAKVQHLLGVQPKTPIYRLQRLRSVDKRSVLYVENYIQPDYFPGLLDKNLEQSLSVIYQQYYDITYTNTAFQLYPIGLHDQAASYLKVTQGSSGLLVTRKNHDQHRRLIDCDFEYWRQDAIVITAETR